MPHTTLKNGQIISLDSLDARLISLNETLEQQSEKMTDQIDLNHSMIQQLKVANIYKSYETDIVVDGEIFNEEKDN
tara:strand:+ start:214 stop:441 length:228 start_codon:yes stop_codon:yes gene_type:complete